MAKVKTMGETIKMKSFGKKKKGKAKNLNTPKGSKVKKYKGQGR
jgi:hypothetical protein